MQTLIPAIEPVPKCCTLCGLIQFISAPDGICDACADLGDTFDDEFADLTPCERAETEAEIARVQAAELKAAKREAGAPNAWLKERFQESGRDIVDFTYDESPESADFVARACGYNQTTWNDSRNVTRREKDGYRKVKEAGKAHLLKCAVAEKQTVTQPAPLSPENWAKTYVAELAMKHPDAARKLAKSLEWQLQQLPSVPVATWQQRAKMAFDAKVKAAA